MIFSYFNVGYPFENETIAHRAFEDVCEDSVAPDPKSKVGEEMCFVFVGIGSSVFRRDEYLVLMKGDVFNFPYEAVDKRLR